MSVSRFIEAGVNRIIWLRIRSLAELPAFKISFKRQMLFLSYTASIVLCLFSLFGVVFLTVLGFCYKCAVSQFFIHLPLEEKDNAAFSCFMGAFIYLVLMGFAMVQWVLNWQTTPVSKNYRGFRPVH